MGVLGCTNVTPPQSGASSDDGSPGTGGAGGIAVGSGGSGGTIGANGGIIGGTGGSGGAIVGGPDAPPDAPAPPPDVRGLLGTGSACTVNSDCALNNCVDSICCDKPCTGCNACKQALTGKADGTCAFVISGQNSHGTCTDETLTKPCGDDGTCDGAGACRKVSNSFICAPASCKAGIFAPAATCDGAGACSTVKTQDCAPFQCTSSGCAKTCATQADCDSTTSFCDTVAKTCTAKKSNGSPASQIFECTSGVVADGFCCDKDCTGCMACSKALNGQTDGQCRAVPANTLAHNACTAANQPCGTTGMCDGTGHCQYAAKATGCGTACTGSTLTTSTCDGAGVCAAGTPTPCAPYACAGSICGSKKLPGATCAATSDCAAGSCVDNAAGTGKVCCSDANPCSKCQGCNTAGTACVAKSPGATDSACAITLSSCETGTCDGAGACQKAPDGTNCGTNRYCSNQGGCGICTPNQDCVPTAPNDCKKGLTSCATGVSQCQATSQNQNEGAVCGAAQICTGSTKYTAYKCATGTCVGGSSTPCPLGCTNNDCTTAVCGNGITEASEQCDNGSNNTNNTYCSNPTAACTLCSTSCQKVTGSFCGDNITQSPNEACDNGTSNSVLDLCSPTCRNCRVISGFDVSTPFDFPFASGLEFTALTAATLYQFKVYHNSQSYVVNLYDITSFAFDADLTPLWTSGFSTPTPGSFFDTINPIFQGTPGVSLNSGHQYLLLKTGGSVQMTSFDLNPGTFPQPATLPALGGIRVTSSYEVSAPLDWWQGNATVSRWDTFRDLHSCMNGLN